MASTAQHACVRCGLPVHLRHALCRDCERGGDAKAARALRDRLRADADRITARARRATTWPAPTMRILP